LLVVLTALTACQHTPIKPTGPLSATGSGDSPEAARDKALGGLSIKLAARVRETCTSTEQYKEDSKGSESKSSLDCKRVISSASWADGRWGEFVRHEDLGGRAGQAQWRSTLDKRRMGRVLSRELDAMLVDYLSRVDAAQAKALTTDVRGFVALWRVLRGETEPAIVKRMHLLTALEKPVGVAHKHFAKARLEIRRSADALRAATPVRVAVANSTDMAGFVGSLLESAALLQLRVLPSSSACSDPAGLDLRVQPQVRCLTNAFSMPTCTLHVAAEVRHCAASEPPIRRSWTQPADQRGIARKDLASARRKALAQGTAEALRSCWSALLQGEVPLP
jgi:hypothetical protein